ncbi:hypothetical protein E3T26_02855 [Cryobacterium sp. TMT1-21]|uniref:DUF4386 family protein n=1 Tax=Cryobacterium shii TaxID=1259235 RepID=A0AAQ2C7V6_9MICO|nr:MULTISPECIES: hypothetical protein [Cryobacterium]TFC51216.1 hypothetical protein E3O49_03830 [Cryobacterium shii]TFC80480.1 hypothetical protein E3T24_16885 [Cryobacterium sp. TmT2-59]TFD17044.1 hypothetical protein E3T26_02855 [Cryobacterium sp. TMT1-21]TFD17508.1 hypothetical protein E3T42_07640 [Cryobacterium sp. TMT4-10]TFD18211.1 hypothetical protein E3T32_12825 [Cryobacterium sp. TMT2-23]
MITTSTLTRAAAVAAAVSGLLYIVIQFIHPADEVASLTTQMWVSVHSLSFAMAILGPIGLTGIYLRQVREFGLLGLIGYALFALFFILQSAFVFAEAFIAPLVAADAPQFAEDFVGLFGRHPAVTDLGPLAALPLVGAAVYVIGAIVFGIAVLRARVLSRGAGILLIAAAAVTPVAGALLPHTLERMAAIPMGLALIWLGYSLWSDQRRIAGRTAPTGHGTRLDRTPAV